MFVVKVFALVAMAAMMAAFPGKKPDVVVLGPEQKQTPASVPEPPKPEAANSGRKRRNTCPSGVSTLTEEEEINALDSHNELRGDAGYANAIAGDETLLTWDSELAGLAQKLVDKCVFEHGENTDCNGRYVGQNLAFTTAAGLSPDYYINLWYNEKSDYTFSTRGCEAGKMCGHYTQVVWSGSRKVGCAQKVCDLTFNGVTYSGATLFACDYFPAGNMVGNDPFTAGTAACSKCGSQLPNNMYKCEDNLCVDCDKSDDAECACIESTCADGSPFNSATCKCDSCTTGKCGSTCQYEDVLPKSHCDHYKKAGYCTAGFVGYMNANCKCSCM